jgi:predicted porin
MRHIPNAIAALAFLALPGVSALAQSSVVIGGTVDVAVRQVKNGSLGTIRSEVSGANSTSKLIIRGTEDLGGGLSAGFYLDGTILVDTGTVNGTFWDRRSTVSLVHRRFGELRMGRDWVPTHLSWSGIDPFFTLGVAGANTFRSPAQSRALGQAFGTTAEAIAQNPTLRVNNAVEYFLPADLGGVYGALMLSAGEGGNAAAGATKGIGTRLGWANKQLNASLASFKADNANAGRAFTDRVWGVSYDFGFVRASVGQRRWAYGSDRTVNTLLGAVIPVGQGVVKLSWLKADQSGATTAQSANDADLLGLGYQYNLSRRSALYAQFARVSNKGGAAFSVPGGPATSGVATAANYFGGQKSTGFEFGLRHDF